MRGEADIGSKQMQNISFIYSPALPQAKFSIRVIFPTRCMLLPPLLMFKTLLCMVKKWHETEFN